MRDASRPRNSTGFITRSVTRCRPSSTRSCAGPGYRDDALQGAYEECILSCMRTTLDLDETLLRRAMGETGARTKTEVIEMGLRALREREARKRLKELYGKGPRLETVKRRR